MAQDRRPFRFGVQISKARPVSEWRERAREAEALGYNIFLMPDHLGPQFAIGPALAVVAEAAPALRIGTLVWQNDWRHPTLLAKEAYTLDVLSEGRFELGIGAGGSFPPEFDWMGVPLAPAGERVGRLEECIRILKAVAGPDPVTFSGKHHTLTEYEGHPKPVQRPYPPIHVGAGGPWMLGIAAREADIISLLPMLGQGAGIDEGELGPEGFDRKIALVREVAGERFPGIELNILIQGLAVTDDRDTGIARLREERGFDSDAWFDSPMVFYGSRDHITETMLANQERFGVSYYAVFEHQLEEFAPIVARLAGH
ncbi:MAG TPA: TIGR03621 family F420-dependent LLM class oxidoreductase [Thermomicrobiales bacterium]|nr:TIGR03621 family F420-dependent LLM class oxidoreductase [Thermomicrobiales bacterium]